MTTAEPRKRTPLRVALLATLLGVIGAMTLFGGSSQATTLGVFCDGKGCIECDPSITECVPPAPTPTPEPSVTPTPAPTPEPSPEPSVTPTPAPTPEPSPEPSVTPEPTPPAPTPSVTPEPTPPAPTPSVTPEPPASTPSPEPSPSTTPALGLAKTGASSANLPWITLVLGALGWGAWNKAQQRRV